MPDLRGTHLNTIITTPRGGNSKGTTAGHPGGRQLKRDTRCTHGSNNCQMLQLVFLCIPLISASSVLCPDAQHTLAGYFDIAAGSSAGTYVHGRLNPLANRLVSSSSSSSMNGTEYVLIESAGRRFEVVNERDKAGRLFGALRVAPQNTSGEVGVVYTLRAELRSIGGGGGECPVEFEIRVVEQTLQEIVSRRILEYLYTEPRTYGRGSFSDSQVLSEMNYIESNAGQLKNLPMYTWTPTQRRSSSSLYSKWQGATEDIGKLGYAYTGRVNSLDNATRSRLLVSIASSIGALAPAIPVDVSDLWTPSEFALLQDSRKNLRCEGYVDYNRNTLSHNQVTHQWDLTDPLGLPALLVSKWARAEIRAQGADKEIASVFESGVDRLLSTQFCVTPRRRWLGYLKGRWGDLLNANYSTGLWQDANQAHRLRGWVALMGIWQDYNKPFSYMPYWYSNSYNFSLDYTDSRSFSSGKSITSNFAFIHALPTPQGVFEDVRSLLLDVYTRPKMMFMSGFLPDGMISHHCDNCQDSALWAYGFEWLNDPLKVAKIVRQTRYAFPASWFETPAKFLVYTYPKIVFKGHLDFGFSGRSYFSDFMFEFWSRIFREAVDIIVDYFAAEISSTCGETVLEALRASTSSSEGPQPARNGNTAFWNVNAMVHRVNGWYMSVRMRSNMAQGAEDFESPGKSWHMGSGLFQVKVYGDEYDMIRARMDWHVLPGVTEEWRTDNIPKKGYRCGGNSFAGTVSDGEIGISAFRYSQSLQETEDYNTATANKGFFFMDFGAVLLGNSINRIKAGQGRPIVTTVDQTRWRGEITYKVSATSPSAATVIPFSTSNGCTTSIAIQPLQAAWIHQAGVGYIISNPFSNQAINLELRCGYSDVVATDSSAKSSRSWGEKRRWVSGGEYENSDYIMLIVIDHGANPSDAEYKYAVVPSKNPNEIGDLAKTLFTSTGIVVLRNDEHAQVVVDYREGSFRRPKSIQAAFYKPQTSITLPIGPGGSNIDVIAEQAVLLQLRRPSTESKWNLTVALANRTLSQIPGWPLVPSYSSSPLPKLTVRFSLPQIFEDASIPFAFQGVWPKQSLSKVVIRSTSSVTLLEVPLPHPSQAEYYNHSTSYYAGASISFPALFGAALTASPTATVSPLTSPSNYPTAYPTAASPAPSTRQPTKQPTKYPSFYDPNRVPSNPTPFPTHSPTKAPTPYPSRSPSNPTPMPTLQPTKQPLPTQQPTRHPTNQPALQPTLDPGAPPSPLSRQPTHAPNTRSQGGGRAVSASWESGTVESGLVVPLTPTYSENGDSSVRKGGTNIGPSKLHNHSVVEVDWAREGRYVLKVQADGRSYPNSDYAYRAELDTSAEAYKFYPGDEYYYTMSFRPDFTWDQVSRYSCVISQWKQVGGGNPPAALRMSNLGDYRLFFRGEYFTSPTDEGTPIGYAKRDAWTDVKVYYKSSTSSSGIIRVWLNGKLAFEHLGRNLASSSSRGYIKFGMYTEIRDMRTLYFDAVRISTFIDTSMSLWIQDQSHLPTISVVSPSNGTSFISGQNIEIYANATDPSGSKIGSPGGIEKVLFFAGDCLIGVSRAPPPFRIGFTPPDGSYSIKAVAKDTDGNNATSLTVDVFVGNRLPSALIISPAALTNLQVGQSAVIAAAAEDSDGTVSRVEFFASGVSIGVDTQAPYTVDWSPPSPGSYALRAVAVDAAGGQGTSKSVYVTAGATISTVSDVCDNDASIREASPTSTGDWSNVEVYRNANAKIVGLFNFNVSHFLGMGGEVRMAQLRLYAVTLKNGGGVFSVFAAQSDSSINEGSVTWSSSPLKGSKITELAVNATNRYFEFDVKAHLVGALARSAQWVTFWVEPNTDYKGFKCYSRRGSQPPRLKVTTSSIGIASQPTPAPVVQCAGISTGVPTTSRPTPSSSSSSYPTPYPNPIPTKLPTYLPLVPTRQPTFLQTPYPTRFPTRQPNTDPLPPSHRPTRYPSRLPTKAPSPRIIRLPTSQPTRADCKLPRYYGRGIIHNTCPDPGSLSNNYLSRGTSCTVSCAIGYVPTTTTNINPSQFVCSVEGRLLRPALKCQEASCQLPSFFTNNVVPSGGSSVKCFAGARLEGGSFCKVGCASGYYSASGTSIYHCHEGTLEAPTLSCIAITDTSPAVTCELPGEFQPGVKGAATGGCLEGQILDSGSSCTVDCKVGYYPVGSRMTREYSCRSPGSLYKPNLRCKECGIDYPTMVLSIIGPQNRTLYTSRWVNIKARGIVKVCDPKMRHYLWRQTSGPYVEIKRPTSNKLLIPKYSLTPGFVYCFKVSYSAMGIQAGIGAWSNTKTQDVCIDAIAKDIKARIRGGDRLVSVTRSFILDGSTSKDPAQRSSRRYDIGYRWRCERVFSSSTAPCFSANAMPPSMASSKLLVPANALEGGQDYYFYLDVSSAYDTRSATARVKISVSLSPTILVGVEVVSPSKPMNESEVHLVDPSRDIVLSATFDAADLAQFRAYTFEWACAGGGFNTGAAGSLSSSYLRIPKSQLAAGRQTTCTVNVRGAGRRSGTAHVILVADAPASGGSCIASQDNGTTLDFDYFTFSCSGWSDPDDPSGSSSSSLWYRFVMLKSSVGGDVSEDYMLGDWAQSPTITVRALPAGLEANAYKQKVRACISDSDPRNGEGAMAYTDFDVTVRPSLLQFNTSSSASSTTNNVEETSLSIIDRELSNSVSNGELGQALQIAAAIEEILQTDAAGNSAQRAERLRRNRNIKESILRSTKNVITNASTQTEVEQGLALLRIVFGSKSESSESVGEEVLSSTLAVLSTVNTNELALSPTMALDIVTSSSVATYVDSLSYSPSNSSSSSRAGSGGGGRLRSFSRILDEVSGALAKGIVPGQNLSIRTDDNTEVKVRKDYVAAFVDESDEDAPGVLFGEQGPDRPKFVVSSRVFQGANFSGVQELETRFYRLNKEAYSFADIGNTTNSDIVVLSFHDAYGGREITINGTGPIDITIPLSTNALSRNSGGRRSCRYFDVEAQAWSTTGCLVHEIRELSTLCRCTHLTAFSTAFSESDSIEIDEGSVNDSDDKLLALPIIIVMVAVAVMLCGGIYWYLKWRGQGGARGRLAKDKSGRHSPSPLELNVMDSKQRHPQEKNVASQGSDFNNSRDPSTPHTPIGGSQVGTPLTSHRGVPELSSDVGLSRRAQSSIRGLLVPSTSRRAQQAPSSVVDGVVVQTSSIMPSNDSSRNQALLAKEGSRATPTRI